MDKLTLGVIVGNRDFFPDQLVSEARREVLGVLAEHGVEAVILDEEATKLGGVETWEDAKKCAALFQANHDRIAGILVVLPNFGDERGIAETIKLSGLQVPILVQAYPDDLDGFGVERRRDAFCGKISVCNNLRQYGFPFSVTELHTVVALVRELQGRPGAVSGRMPGRRRDAARPAGRRRRQADRLQYRTLQREDPPGVWHQRDHRGPVSGPRLGRQVV